MIRITLSALLLLGIAPSACAQTRPDLFDCEGCEAIRETSFDRLAATARIADASEPGARLIISGRVTKPDGRTPAPGVVVYAYHTNAQGAYPTRGDETGWGRRHGYLRAWVVSDSSGMFRFETIRPAPYPGRTDPAHVHLIIKEPGRQEYYIDDIVFTDDPLVTPAYRRQLSGRGGTGVVTPERGPDGSWTVRRDIVLER